MANSNNLTEEELKILTDELRKANEYSVTEKIERPLAAVILFGGWVAAVVALIWNLPWLLSVGLVAVLVGLWLRSTTVNQRLKRLEIALALHLHQNRAPVE